MGCLDKVIKLSRTQCACFDTGKPLTYNEGQSEVYLDELEGLNLSLVDSAADCEEGNLWELMDKARTNATLAFKADLLSCIQDNFISRRPNYSGLIGQVSANQTVSLTGYTEAGELLSFPRIVGGKVTLKRIGLLMNAAVAVTVNVYNNDQNTTTPIGTYTINTVANTATYGTLSPALELPMWSENVTNLEYYIVYTIGAFLPKNNKTECVPCSGGAKKVAWVNWLQVYGIKGTGTDYSSFTRTPEVNGLILDVDLKCDASRVICSDEYPLDFKNDGKALQMAYAIRFKAGAILIDEILSSPQINRFTMMDREALYGKRNHYRSNYEQWISYLCKNTEILNNDCWMCKPSNLIRRGPILV